MHLIVGLGNPGSEYQNTRHNIGFELLNQFATQHQLEWKTDKYLQSDYLKYRNVILLKPLTMMNNSGIAVKAAIDKFHPASLTVVHDELDLPIGTYKVQNNRGAAGHNGVKSIIEHVNFKNIERIRIGIGRSLSIPIADYVLQPFSSDEKRTIQSVYPTIMTFIEQKLST